MLSHFQPLCFLGCCLSSYLCKAAVTSPFRKNKLYLLLSIFHKIQKLSSVKDIIPKSQALLSRLETINVTQLHSPNSTFWWAAAISVGSHRLSRVSIRRKTASWSWISCSSCRTSFSTCSSTLPFNRGDNHKSTLCRNGRDNNKKLKRGRLIWSIPICLFWCKLNPQSDIFEFLI